MSDLHLLAAAERAADRAAAFLRTAVPDADPAAWTAKRSRDFVTDVDRTAETLIREELERTEPGGRVLGEEFGGEAVGAGLVWVVDPLDGTTNFLHRVPHWAVSIAAVVDGVTRAGVVVHVPRAERYTAVRGGGAWCDGARLAVSTIDDPAFALLATGFPFIEADAVDAYLAGFRRVARRTSGVRRAGAAALDLADVACGRYDAFWELRLAPWDIAAGALLVEEAGGVVTDLRGAPLPIAHTGVCAGNRAMQGWLLGEVGRRQGGETVGR